MEKYTYIKSCLSAGCEKINTLEMSIKPLHNDNLQNGDIITIPEDWRECILQKKYSFGFLDFLIVEAKRGNHNEVIKFFPKELCKIVKDGDAIYTTGGTVAEFVQCYPTMAEALDAMEGKSFVALKRQYSGKKYPYFIWDFNFIKK